MPSPKLKTGNSKQKTATGGVGYRLSGFLIIVVFASLGLVWMWMQLPKRSEQPVPRPPVIQPSETTNPAKTSCKESGGTWIDCGLPAGCTADEPCAQVCVPQCLAKVAPEPLPEPTTPVRERPTGMICDDRNFICVEDSVENSLLASPFTVKGTGIAFENNINWRLLDGNGDVLEKGFVTADAARVGQVGTFEIRTFILQVPRTSMGTLEVLEYSAEDGSPTHVVKIPVRLPQTTMPVKIYLTPYDVGNDCSKVFEDIQSVVRTNLPIEASLRKLLVVELGPGDTTEIPNETKLVSLKVSSGTATVVFSSELQNYGGGSCNVQAIRAQIESTLKQFSSIKNVIISVEGKTPEETLQP